MSENNSPPPLPPTIIYNIYTSIYPKLLLLQNFSVDKILIIIF